MRKIKEYQCGIRLKDYASPKSNSSELIARETFRNSKWIFVKILFARAMFYDQKIRNYWMGKLITKANQFRYGISSKKLEAS